MGGGRSTIHSVLHRQMSGVSMKLRGVVFDMDGTLTVPNLDFAAMYREAGVPAGEDILSAKWRSDSRASQVVEETEEEGRRTLQLMPGATELAQWLHAHEIPMSLVTRNSSRTVNFFYKHHWQPAGLPPFDPAISRDDDFPAKPDPAALTSIAHSWGVAVDKGLLMVGDSLSNDIAFGQAAGVHTALLNIGGRALAPDSDIVPDICVTQLTQLATAIWKHFEIESALCAPELHAKRSPPEAVGPAAQAALKGDSKALEQMDLQMLAMEEESTGNTPMIFAADEGHLEAVRVLVDAGAPLDVRGYLGATAVSRAARRGHVEVLELLLSHGASSELANNKLQYPLHFAAFKLQPEAVEVLLRHQANPFVLDRKGRTPAEDTSSEAIRAVIQAEQNKRFLQAVEGSKL